MFPAQVKESIDGGGTTMFPPFLLDGLLHESGNKGITILIRECFLEGPIKVRGNTESDYCHSFFRLSQPLPEMVPPALRQRLGVGGPP